MSRGPLSRTRHRQSYERRAYELVLSVDDDCWGSVHPSLYETARVTSWAPWLDGHERRLTWLLKQQARDGSWGEGPAPYRLLPTLSVTEALLSSLGQGESGEMSREQLAAAADNGLAALRDLSSTGGWPDTAAIEILVPELTALINEHLDRPAVSALPQLGAWARGQRLSQPRGFQPALPGSVAEECRLAGRVPPKLHHTFEGVARHLPQIPAALPDGLLGSSPAATAAWLTVKPGAIREQTVNALASVGERYDGLFPEATPITAFERLWVSAALARPGLPSACVAYVRAWVAGIYATTGVRGAPGLLPDSDDTAMAVLVSALAGSPRDPSPLSAFEADDHYDCYVDEDTPSSTANAHALQALTACLSHQPTTAHPLRTRMDLTRNWLLDQQQPDGAWYDKWHASPYYATERCVTAISGHTDPTTRDAVRSACEWVLASQHSDGSWGVWGGTAEETAYAAKTLLSSPDYMRRPAAAHALSLAEEILSDVAHSSGYHHPALWHDKTLYAPGAMAQAEVTAALELVHTRRP